MAAQEETMMLERGADYLFVCAEFNLARHAFKDAIDDYDDAIQRYKNSAIPAWKKYSKAVKGLIKATHSWAKHVSRKIQVYSMPFSKRRRKRRRKPNHSSQAPRTITMTISNNASRSAA
ncbi:unnamed protein product [Owenia fusiformis]|uniref:Uncharacterized protein n=1 Tax=Owenia fusiformis TaxID=6347 RepID=A0A8S4Q964_OWEFU|nr:unnamed protein product [Owenia fusiformis]